MFRSFLLAAALLSLSACATALEGATQEVTLTTPGVEDARCVVENNYFRYVINPPRTFMLERTSQPYKITCIAPGNRVKSISIPAGYEDWAFLNAANGVIPGTAVDAVSGALFAYPDAIAVDFTGMAPTAMPLPYYQQMFRDHPEMRGMEAFRPGVAALHSDIGSAPVPMQKRPEGSYDGSGLSMGPGDAAGNTPASSPVQVDLGVLRQNAADAVQSVPRTDSQSTADAMTRAANPAVFGGDRPALMNHQVPSFGNGASSSSGASGSTGQ